MRGIFPDTNDRYPNGSAKHKEYVGLVIDVYEEVGYKANRVKVLVQGQVQWAMDYSLRLVG